jgi:hypothetical protein
MPIHADAVCWSIRQFATQICPDVVKTADGIRFMICDIDDFAAAICRAVLQQRDHFANSRNPTYAVARNR